MNKFTNPLDDIKVASPCPANWNEMRGDERRRYCSECKLNVYNLSEMTRPEAENFMINAEGRVCVKFYRRNDGTILTKDCPVGWQAARKRVSRAAKAFVSVCAGIFGGIFAFNQFQPKPEVENMNFVRGSKIEANFSPNTVEDFVNIPSSSSISNLGGVSNEDFDAVVGMVVAPEKIPVKKIPSKKTRRR